MHVSVTFTYDKAWAEHLAEQWRHVAPVKIGGVAYGDPGAEFISGRYIIGLHFYVAWLPTPLLVLLGVEARSSAAIATDQRWLESS